MKRRLVRGRGDDGLALIFLALVLVALMIFAAFAVDLGGLYNARRQDQNAADTASLAGAQNLSNDAEILNQVDLRASDTLDVSPGSLNWTSCSLFDADFVDTPIVVAGVTYNCITKNSGATLLQVKLSNREYESFFGQAIGVSSYTHNAFAIAGQRAVGFGSILPFGLPAGAAGSNIECMKDGPGGHSESPCDGPSSGNFGYLDFTFYGNLDRGTPQVCTGHEGERIANNIAAGIDHDLSKYTGSEIRESSECGGTERNSNAMFVDTGNRTSSFGSGIYSGNSFTDGQPARLKRVSELPSWATTETVDGHRLDDNPLWEFIDPVDENGNGSFEVPTSCLKEQFTRVIANDFSLLPDGTTGAGTSDIRSYVQSRPTKEEQLRVMLDRCFTHYRGNSYTANGAISGSGEPSTCAGACTDPVFGRNSSSEDSPDLYDIQYTPRFGYVPQLTTNFGSPAATPNVYYLNSFRAVFMQRLLGGCNAAGSCTLDHEPFHGRVAQEDDAPFQGQAEAMTSWVFPSTMLPNGLSGEDAPFALGLNRFISLVR